MKQLKNVGLFLLAPWIGLLYVIILPWFCMYHLVSCGLERSAIEIEEAVQNDTLVPEKLS